MGSRCPTTTRCGAGRSTTSRPSGATSRSSSRSPSRRLPARVLGGETMPGAEWFPGATLNFASAVLGRDVPDDRVAMRHLSELRPARHDDARRAARLGRADRGAAARARRGGGRPRRRGAAERARGRRGVARGRLARCDLVVGGAGVRRAARSPTASRRSSRSCSSRPTATATAARTSTGWTLLDGLLDELPTVRHSVLLPYLDPDADPGRLRGGMPWSELDDGGEPPPLETTPSRSRTRSGSSTPRAPPGCPSRSCTATAARRSSLRRCCASTSTCRRDDRLLWFTTTGWMMWNFLVAGLLTDGEIVLYDGNPGHPGHGGAVGRRGRRPACTIFGTSAAYIGACAKAGVHPRERGDLSALRAVGSTGLAALARGVRLGRARELGDLWLFSTSGGTDVCTAFVGGVPTLPVNRGELQARSLGAAIESWSPAGTPLVGEVGELVVTRADALDAGRSSGATRTASATARATSRRGRGSGGTATGSRSASAARR